jgi:hypothetical protein
MEIRGLPLILEGHVDFSANDKGDATPLRGVGYKGPGKEKEHVSKHRDVASGCFDCFNLQKWDLRIEHVNEGAKEDGMKDVCEI